MKNILTSNQREEIMYACMDIHIYDKEYTINNDGSISCSKTINVDGFGIKELPVVFADVNGHFSCFDNKLTTLKGSPSSIWEYGRFTCSKNMLTSLEYSTPIVGGLYCNDNQISTLIGCPTIMRNSYSFSNNSFPDIVMEQLLGIPDNQDNINLFVKFQEYYEVWKDGFNEQGFKDLMLDLSEGLR